MGGGIVSIHMQPRRDNVPDGTRTPFNPIAFRRAPFAFRRGWCGANFVLVMKTASSVT